MGSQTGEKERDQIPEFLYDQFPSEITTRSLNSTNDSPYSSLIKDSVSPHNTVSPPVHIHKHRTPQRQLLTVDTSVNTEGSIPVKIPKTPRSANRSSQKSVSPLYNEVSQKFSSIFNSSDASDSQNFQTALSSNDGHETHSPSQFTFENPASHYEDQQVNTLASSTPVKELKSLKTLTRGVQPLISDPNDSVVLDSPENCTIDVVVKWLRMHQFNESWIKVFTENKLEKDKFYDLQSYKSLNRFIHQLDTTDSYSTPTRFLQLLRKEIAKQTSYMFPPPAAPSFLTPSSPTSIISSSTQKSSPLSGEVHSVAEGSHSSGSYVLSNRNDSQTEDDPEKTADHSASDSAQSKTTKSSDTTNIGDNHLVPVVSAPIPQMAVERTQDTPPNSASPRLVPRPQASTKPRPLSTIEKPTYTLSGSPSTASYSPPVVRHFTRRHKKSSSSDTSLFGNSTIGSGIPGGSMFSVPDEESESNSPSSIHAPRHRRSRSRESIYDNATTPKGLFTKFFGKNKSSELSFNKATKKEESPISPISITSMFSSSDVKRSKKASFDTEKKRISMFLGDYGFASSEKKKRSNEEFLRRRSTMRKKSAPSFEKLGPVGKKPSPTGVTIPVITTSKLHSGQSTFSLSTSNIRKANELAASAASLSAKKADLPYLFVDEKYRPVVNDEAAKLHVLITADNINFRAVEVDSISTVSMMKDTFTRELGFTDGELSRFYLTDFGCSRGEPLEESVLRKLLDSQFFGGVCKIFVQPLTKLKAIPSGDGIQLSLKSASTSSASSPVETSEKTPDREEYLTFKTESHMPTSSNDEISLKTPSTSIIRPKTKTRSPSITRAKSVTRTSGEQAPLGNPFSSSASSSAHTKSFRVIRSERREIDFDKRRASPFASPPASNLIALRSAPPPPTLQAAEEEKASPVTNASNSSTKSKNKTVTKTNRKPPPALPAETLALMERRSSLKKLMSLTRKATIRRKNTTVSDRSRFDPFAENKISFAGAPELESSSSSEDSDSDDDLFAKVPSKPATSIDPKKAGGEDIQAKISGTDSDLSYTLSSSDSSLDIRPPAEVVYDNLELYFPNADLDKLIIDEVVSPPVSPIVEHPVQTKKVRASRAEGKFHRMKSIRIVAQEAKREAVQRQKKAPGSSLLRRKSTKMWGQKVIEVTPGTNSEVYVNKLRDKKGGFKQFAWVKGELIGVGTFGKVYLALNVTTGEMIAVKQTTISSKFLNNRETKEIVGSFTAEVETLKDLDHENIVQYLGFGMKDNTYSIFLEYVSGGSVGHLIRSYGMFPEDLIRYLTRQVLQGLTYIHSKGILHRDLKADNLLLETDGVCKISDFGISKKSKDIYSNESAMTFQGTIFWMAPEIIDAQSHKGYNAKVDIWSLGCVVLEMYAGKRPWHDYAVAGAIFRLGKKSAPPISEETRKNISESGVQFLRRCFEIDPDKRPTAAELLQDDFCKEDPDFRFENTELSKRMRFDDVQEKRRVEMLRRSARR
ncbi:DEKNAAC100297 [Brettanomyces naardenensis]|uniref:DEKNAAC100297 n=1 Tax=Brettanomyces naardenensis TaxID=13370 RepID=A0A448YF71_BRENA|nr:DEKNAAC100297 [Brettanomyces naardenensis]